MERTMSVEDKIRRAEEIYNRKRENEYRNTNARVRVDNIKNTNINQRLRKMIIQIIVCMLIYLIFHYILNSNYIFSEDIRKKCQEILSYDISLSEMYKSISGAITSIQEKYQQEGTESIENKVVTEGAGQENIEQQNEQDVTGEQENTSEQTGIYMDENIRWSGRDNFKCRRNRDVK